MTLIGGGGIGQSNISKTIILNDIAGVDGFVLKDADGFVVFRVDSKGNVKRKGNITRV